MIGSREVLILKEKKAYLKYTKALKKAHVFCHG